MKLKARELNAAKDRMIKEIKIRFPNDYRSATKISFRQSPNPHYDCDVDLHCLLTLSSHRKLRFVATFETVTLTLRGFSVDRGY